MHKQNRVNSDEYPIRRTFCALRFDVIDCRAPVILDP